IAKRRAPGPFLEPRLDLARQDVGPSLAPVLPREIGIPRRPMRLEQLIVAVARECEIAARQRVLSPRLGMAAPVAESIKLLDIAPLEPGLPLHPFAQTEFGRAVGA